MSCAGCGLEVSADFAFCPRCGRALDAPCPGCGFACPSEFAFCPKCGTSVRPPATPVSGRGGAARSSPPPAPTDAGADRRPVTVLFADLSGFTTLGERLDPEEVRTLQGELFEEMASVIKRYDGFVEKFVGDAVMAVFGAPSAHEDDPERALHAALGMHERATALNGRWEPRLGSALRLHVGIHTGPVVAGSLGAAADAAYAVTGDTVNTAARLQGAAAPGQTVVSAATYALTRHAFSFEALGGIALKGKAEQVTAYGLVGVAEIRVASRGLEAHGLVAPLVGRDEAVAQMLAAFDRVEGGRAEVVSLVGEVGVGKTRLLAEFFARLDAAGRLQRVTIRRAACSSLGERAYGVVGSFFREAFGIAAGDALPVAEAKVLAGLPGPSLGSDETARFLSVLRYVLGLAPDARTEPDSDPELLRRQIFLTLRSVFERRLAHGSLILVVEDLHWADAASVELLQFMVERLADRPLMLLFTYRPTFDARPLVTNRATHTTIRLSPLSAGDCGALLGAFFGRSRSGVPDGLRELVVRRSGGNPFYLEEIVRGLIASGDLRHESDGWRCTTDTAALEVPATLQGLLLSRMDRLPPAVRRVAQEASVLGLTFDAPLLDAVLREPGGCQATLELLEEAELVEEVTPAGRGTSGSSSTDDQHRRYRFTHGLVHEVIYQNLLVRRRAELHERAGRALEVLVEREDRPRRLEDLEALGYHFSRSADKIKGARHLVAAADWARAVYANADAVRNYEQALRTLEEGGPGDAEQVAVEERLADVLGLMGRRDAALSRFAAVLRAAAASGDRPAQARLHRKMAVLHWSAGQRELARQTLEAGLALLEGQGQDLELAHLYQEMGRLLFRSGDSTGAIAWAERALAQAERLVPHVGPSGPGLEESRKEAAAAVSHAYNTLGVALARVERLDEAVRHIQRSVEVAQTHGLLQAACRGYANLSVLYSTVDPGQAIGTCRQGLDLAKQIGDPAFQSRLYANLAVAYCALTNRCDGDGVAAAQAAIELDRQLGELDHLAVPLIVLGQIYQCHGQPDLALRHYREALALAEEVGEPQLLFPCYDGLATLHLDLDDMTAAETYMRKAREVCERAGVEPDSLTVLPFLA
jgi:adenylate cyclase